MADQILPPTFKLKSVNIQNAFENTPPPQDFVFPGLLAGSVGALVSPGATGKSFLMLEAAMAVAGGTDLLGFEPSKAGGVLYFAAEDPTVELERRVHAVGAHLSQEARAAVAKNLYLVDAFGQQNNIMDNDFRDFLISRCLRPDGSQVVRLIVFDTVSRIHQLDENSNRDMIQLVGQLETIAARTGAAIIFLHHVSKSSASNGVADQQQAARGASALIDNARWCGFVAKMTKEEAEQFNIDEDERRFYVRYGVSKQNYGSPLAEKWMFRHEGGVLKVHDLAKATPKPKKAAPAKSSAKPESKEDW
jgi:RecA-family ATPase